MTRISVSNNKNTMKLSLPLVFVILSTSFVQAQNLSAYTDYRDRFYIFDEGTSTKVEDLKPQSFKVGGEGVLYVNAQGNLKLYSEGVVSKLESGGVSQYFTTDHILAYSIFEKLIVIENGKKNILSTRCPIFRVEDSLIVYFDRNLESLRVYYDGESIDIESGLVGMPVEHFTSGDNIVAYISYRLKNFKVYYKGENRTLLENVEEINFKAGRDIVAYENPLENNFNAFYKGEIYKLDDFMPKSFKTGDDFVAYVNEMGEFKVFFDGEIYEASSFTPQAYYAEDNLLLFAEYEYLKLFYMGEVYEIEGYIPKNFKLDWNTLAYLDNTNRIWLFSKGEKQLFSNDLINSFDLYRDLIQMNVKVNRNVTYYKGQFIEGETM